MSQRSSDPPASHLHGDLFLDLANGERSLAEVLAESAGRLREHCPRCRAALAGYSGLAPAASPSGDRVDSTVARVAERTNGLRHELDEARSTLIAELLDHPLEEALGLLLSSPRLRTWGVAAALLDDAAEATRWGPASVAQGVAKLAAAAAARLDTSRYPRCVVEDVRSSTLAALAAAHLRYGAVEAAARELDQAEEHLRRGTGTWFHGVQVALARAKLDLARAHPRWAARRATIVLQQASRKGEPEAAVEAALLMASAAADGGAPDLGLTALDLAEAAWSGQGGLSAEWRAVLRMEVGRAYANCGSFPEAWDELELAAAALPRLRYPLLENRLLRLRGSVLFGLARTAEAEEVLREAWGALLDLGEGLEAARAGLDLAFLHAAAGRDADFAQTVDELAEALRLETLPRAGAAVLLRFQARARGEGADPYVVADAREGLYLLGDEDRGAVH